MDYVLKNYSLTQKNYIAFGIIAKEQRISATDLSKQLQLLEEDRLRSYVSNLVSHGLVLTCGNKKGTQYKINPQLITNAKANVRTTLRTVETHVLKALILEDINKHPYSSFSEILHRLKDVDERDVRKVLYKAYKDGEIDRIGTRGDCKYLPI